MREQPIRIRVLGAAAGGGLPQWNCACENCAAARAGKVPQRTQSSIAISPDGEFWLLINASPDLRAQIEAFPSLHPGAGPARNSPICDVVLTNADLDHVLGLFLLREHGEKLRVHCTAAVRDTLRGALQIDALLGSFCGIEWRELPETLTPLRVNGGATSLAFRAIPLPGGPPHYASASESFGWQSVALEFADQRRAGTLLVVAPDVAAITPELQSALEATDIVLFDGTFWSGNELRAVDPTARTAAEMGHIPISGGSLEVLRGLRARHRIYIHVNNTNPIFQPGTHQRAEVEKAGIAIGEDNMEFEL